MVVRVGFHKNIQNYLSRINKKTSTIIGKRIRYDYSQISRPKVLFPRKRTEKTADAHEK